MNKVKDNNGFTLIEMLVYILIFSSFIYMSSEFIIRGIRSTTFSIEQDEATRTARKVVTKMTMELRESSGSSRGDYLLDDVSPQSLSFYSNIDDDSYIEKVRYFIDGTFLKKGIIKPTGSPLEYLSSNENIQTVSDYINNKNLDVFSYYDTNQNKIVNPGGDKNKIRLINIYLFVNVTPEIMPADYILNMNVNIRNLKDNL